MDENAGFIEKRRRKIDKWIGLGLLVVLLSVPVCLFLPIDQPPWPLFAAAGLFAVIMLTLILRGVHCPKCKGDLTPLVFRRGWVRSTQQYKYCPCCGERLE